MFTGLVERAGHACPASSATARARRCAIAHAAGRRELQEGDSVAVNGVCLTATDRRRESFGAEAMQETLERLARWASSQAGARVNLELPLRAGDRLGGHVVQGHVDGTATVRAVREEGFSRVLEIECPAALLRYLVREGLGRARRRQPHRQRAATDDGFAVVADPRDARAHDARRAARGRRS